MNIETNDAYWEEIMTNRRNPETDEVNRLTTALYGFLHRHNAYAEEIGDTYGIMGTLEFWDSKRPYGNKNIPDSIAYNLGWDYKRLLTTSALPTFVKEEAWKLHELVKDHIIKEESFIQKVREEEN